MPVPERDSLTLVLRSSFLGAGESSKPISPAQDRYDIAPLSLVFTEARGGWAGKLAVSDGIGL